MLSGCTAGLSPGVFSLPLHPVPLLNTSEVTVTEVKETKANICSPGFQLLGSVLRQPPPVGTKQMEQYG